MSADDNNLVWHQHKVNKQSRASLKKQKPCVLWFTGLSGSGKSTIAGAVEEHLARLGKHTYLLDGDNVRLGLCKDLGFGDADRKENIRRIAELSKLFVDSGCIVITAFISPYIEDREIARNMVDSEEFIEIFVDTPLELCKQRDPKGLYKKAIAGEIANFTGISSEYQAPPTAEIHLRTESKAVSEVADQVVQFLTQNGYLNA